MFEKIGLHDEVSRPIQRVENDQRISRYVNVVGKLTQRTIDQLINFEVRPIGTVVLYSKLTNGLVVIRLRNGVVRSPGMFGEKDNVLPDILQKALWRIQCWIKRMRSC